MMRSARDDVSACASVLSTMKSTPDRPDTIILLTALPPAPPTPQTMIRGFNSLSSGALRLIDITSLISQDARRRRLTQLICLGARRVPRFRAPSSKALLQPTPHARNIAVALPAVPRGRPSLLEMFEARD